MAINDLTINHPIPIGEVDDAFRYLIPIVGRGELAIYQLHENLLAGSLQMTANFYIDGVLKSTKPVPAYFWRHHLSLGVVDGHAVIHRHLPLRNLIPSEVLHEPGVRELKFTLAIQDVERLWEKPRTAAVADAPPTGAKTANGRVSTKAWCVAEAERLKAARKLPEDLGIVAFAKLLADGLAGAAKTNKSLRPVSSDYIRNSVRDWGIWPINIVK
jgi:hypothetical protein